MAKWPNWLHKAGRSIGRMSVTKSHCWCTFARSWHSATQRRHASVRETPGMVVTDTQCLVQPSERSKSCACCGTSCTLKPFYMTHGVRVELCIVHRRGEYLRRDGGHTFVRQLHAFWRTIHGAVRPWCEAAARTHVLRVTGRLAKDGPGSYSWDAMRFEAEERFASGEEPKAVIASLRVRHSQGPARAPAARTMRRWFYEGRWLMDPQVTAMRIAKCRSGANRWRPVLVQESPLGMCIFRPTLAWAKNINPGDALSEALTTARSRMGKRSNRIRR